MSRVLAFMRQDSWAPGGKQFTQLLLGTARWPLVVPQAHEPYSSAAPKMWHDSWANTRLMLSAPQPSLA